MYRWFIAHKYLFSRIITFAALVVIAASISLLIVIISVMEGFRSELQTRIRGTSSDLKVESTNYIGLREPDKVASIIEKVPGVQATAPFVETVVFYRTSVGFATLRDVKHRYLRVLDLERELKVGELQKYLDAVELPSFPWLSRDPRVVFTRDWARKCFEHAQELDVKPRPVPEPFPDPVLVGQEAYLKLGLYPGATLRMTGYSPSTQGPRSGEFVVAGYFKTGLYEIDAMTILMERGAAKDFLGLVLEDGRETASGVRIDVSPEFETEAGLDRLRSEIETALDREGVTFARTLTWRNEKSTLLGAVRVEKGIMSIILGVIILFGGLMMFIILTLLVVEKTRDLGVMQSLGATPYAISSIFFRIGTALCASGVVIGTAHGIGFALIVNTVQRWITLLTGYEVFPPNVYYIDHIPVKFETADLLWIIVPTVLVSVLSSSIPAIRAARKDPVVALRYE